MSADPCLQRLEALERTLRARGDGAGVAAELRSLRQQIESSIAARAQAQVELEHLRESEERWRSMVENPFDFISVVDADGTFLYVNHTAPGITREQLIGRATAYDFSEAGDHAAIRAALEKVFRSGVPADYEAYSPQLDAWFSNVVGPIVRDGKVLAASILTRNVTVQKKAQLALVESEARFRQLAEHIQDVFFLIDAETHRVLYTSPAYEALWGRSRAEVYEDGTAWLAGVHPDDRERLQQRYQAMLAACRGESVDFTFAEPGDLRILQPSGAVRWARSRLFPIRDGAGKLVRLAGVVVDLTERKEAELKLAAAEAKYRLLVEKLPVISYIAAIDEPRRAIYISPQIEAKLGFTQEEWLQDADLWRERIHPEDRDRVLAELRRFRRGGKALRTRYRLLSRDGEELWFHDEAVLVRDATGKPECVQGVILDVSEAQVARAERERSWAVSARLVEVQEDERKRIARELHDEIGQILTSLNFLLQAVRECPGERPGTVEDARALVTELMTRVEDLSLQLRPALLDELGLLPALLSMFDRLNRVRVDFQHYGVEGRFGTDVETAAYRIVQEALTNVARHAGVQDVAVRAHCDGKTLALQIEDRGSGFDAVPRNDASRGRGLDGMRERVALLGGELSIDSQPGRGTCVGVRLPLASSQRWSTLEDGGAS